MIRKQVYLKAHQNALLKKQFIFSRFRPGKQDQGRRWRRGNFMSAKVAGGYFVRKPAARGIAINNHVLTSIDTGTEEKTCRKRTR